MASIGFQLGHCFRTTGATGTPGCCGTTEQEYVSHLYDVLAPKVQAAGHTPLRILADPSSYPSMNAFIAMHCDGSTNMSARGCSFGFRTDLSNAPASKAWGDYWRSRHHARGYPGGDQPTNYTSGLAGYYALDNAKAAGANRAIVVEFGFLTNTADNEWLTTHYGTVADALVDTIVHFYGGVQPQEDEFMSFLDLSTADQDKIIDRFWMRLARGEKVDGTFPAHMVAASLSKIREWQDLFGWGDGRQETLATDTHADINVRAANDRLGNLAERLTSVEQGIEAIKAHFGI